MRCPKCEHVFNSEKIGAIHFRREGVGGPALCGKKKHPDEDGSDVSSKPSKVSCIKCLGIIAARIRIHAKALEDMINMQAIDGRRVQNDMCWLDGPEPRG